MTFNGADGFNPHGPDEKDSSRDLNVAVADLVGFRAFRLGKVLQSDTGAPGQLTSVTYSKHCWTPSPQRAQPCGYIPGSYHSPRRDCSCGFYAYHHTRTYEYARDQDTNVIVEGLIRGWGRCIIGDLGFRSEWAHIIALVVPADRVFPDTWLTINRLDQADAIEAVTTALEDRYRDIPVYASTEALLEDHPLTGPLGRPAGKEPCP